MNLIHTVPGDTSAGCHLLFKSPKENTQIPFGDVRVHGFFKNPETREGFAFPQIVGDDPNDHLLAFVFDQDFLFEFHNYSSLGERYCSHQTGRNPRNSRRFHAKKKKALETCFQEALQKRATCEKEKPSSTSTTWWL